jgi:hypothetical protein
MRRHFRKHDGVLDGDELDGDGASGGGGTRSGNAYPPELDEDMERRARPRARSGAATSLGRCVVRRRSCGLAVARDGDYGFSFPTRGIQPRMTRISRLPGAHT